MAEIGEGGGGEGRNIWKIFLWNCLRNRKIVLNFATAKGTEEQRRLRRSPGEKGDGRAAKAEKKSWRTLKRMPL